MAGSRIKGITVEIGGDTTKLQSALKGVNSEIKNTQSQLKDVEKLLKYDALQREIIETEEDLKKLETQANQSATAVQKIAIAGESLKTAGALCFSAEDTAEAMFVEIMPRIT